MRDDSVYLRHVDKCIALIERYLGGPKESLQRNLFFEDQRTQDAVLRRLETLSDAASHLSDTLKGRHPEIAWRQISAFRNVLAHGYTDILLEEVWRVIIEDLGALKTVALAEVRPLGD